MFSRRLVFAISIYDRIGSCGPRRAPHRKSFVARKKTRGSQLSVDDPRLPIPAGHPSQAASRAINKRCRCANYFMSFAPPQDLPQILRSTRRSILRKACRLPRPRRFRPPCRRRFRSPAAASLASLSPRPPRTRISCRTLLEPASAAAPSRTCRPVQPCSLTCRPARPASSVAAKTTSWPRCGA